MHALNTHSKQVPLTHNLDSFYRDCTQVNKIYNRYYSNILAGLYTQGEELSMKINVKEFYILFVWICQGVS